MRWKQGGPSCHGRSPRPRTRRARRSTARESRPDRTCSSGIVGIDPSTGSLAGDTIQDQTRQALENCQAILQAGGASLDDVIEVGILLTHPADFAGLNEEYARWFPSGPPTRYVAKLGVELPGLLVSIRMTAFIT